MQRTGIGVLAVIRRMPDNGPRTTPCRPWSANSHPRCPVGGRRRCRRRAPSPDRSATGRQCRRTTVPRHQRHRRREVAARAVARYRHEPAVRPDAPGILRQPARDRIAVLDRTGEFRFWAQPIIHRRHHAPRRIRQCSAWPVDDLQIADDPPAAMKIHHQRQCLSRRRMIQPHRQRTGRTRNQDVSDLGNVFRLALQIAEAQGNQSRLRGLISSNGGRPCLANSSRSA